MLQSMRHLAQSWFFKGLMLILMVSFGIWGVGDIFRSNLFQGKLATVGDTTFTVEDLQHNFEIGMGRARQMFGPDFTIQQAKQMGMIDQTLEGMIQRAAFDQEIEKLGINVNSQVLIDRLAAQSQFRDKNGNFNAPLFRQLLKQQGIDENTFLTDGRKEIMRDQVLGVMQTESPPPDLMIDALYKARGQKRIYDIVTIRNDQITDIPTPDDKTLHDYYQNHPQPFTAPEYRGITIARLSNDEVLKGITITDEQLHKAYEDKSAEFEQPERRDFVEVIMQDETKAGLMAVAARQSNDLKAAAKEKGYDSIPINNAEQSGLPPELAQAAFSLKPGEVSQPIHTALGWLVLQLVKITPPGKPAFDTVKDQLRETMRHDQAADASARTVNQLDDQLAAGHSLDDIADELKLRLIKIPAIDAEGKTPDGKTPPELPNKDDVLKTAFGQNSGDTSPIIDDKAGNYYVVRTDDVTPAAAKPYDKVQPQVAAAWKAAEQAKRAQGDAEKVATDIRGGKAPSFFTGHGMTYKTSKPISLLGDNDPEVPVAILPQLLKLGKNDVTTIPLADSELVVRLDHYEDAAPANPASKGKISGAIKEALPKEWADQYIHYVQTLFPVKINQNMLDNFRQLGG